jgi:hypothetical protein
MRADEDTQDSAKKPHILTDMYSGMGSLPDLGEDIEYHAFLWSKLEESEQLLPKKIGKTLAHHTSKRADEGSSMVTMPRSCDRITE